jgi:hypothetical protein
MMPRSSPSRYLITPSPTRTNLNNEHYPIEHIMNKNSSPKAKPACSVHLRVRAMAKPPLPTLRHGTAGIRAGKLP